MTEKAIAYLRARAKIMRGTVSNAAVRMADRRCSPHTRVEWKECYDFAREELRMVEEAITELESLHGSEQCPAPDAGA